MHAQSTAINSYLLFEMMCKQWTSVMSAVLFTVCVASL
jgi:hypothetical protein